MGNENRETSFPIVGIGASAGGLNALHCFVGELPKEFGFAVVFMQHLSTKHRSLLADLLQSRRPDIGICEITAGLAILPGKIYLCPPGNDVSIQKGIFFVSPSASKRLNFPIDKFFVSLAEEAGEQAIAVILSGAGTDGARGIAAIRDEGGTVFVQDPATAEFPGMPLASSATGQADAVMPPEDIAREILKMQGAVPAGADKDFNPADFETFLRLIREKTGYIFSHYKRTVLGRRIRRRMYLRGVSSVQGYINMVAEKNLEAADLASDFMIGVTSFFRDRLAWKTLKTDVIKKFVASNDDQPLRIWTPACATGEEAYSIAMMLGHEFDLAGRRRNIQVFATDINDIALEKAREGKYPGSVIADLPPDYMKKFFTCSEDCLSVIVNKEMRESVVFARQDLLSDPPFSRLDLIICRNLLIYFEPEAQEKCIALFHYALKDGGYLFLGNAETPDRKGLLFKSLGHKRCRIYQKIETAEPARPSLTASFTPALSAVAPSRAPAGYKQNLTEFIQQELLDQYGPIALAINQHYDIIYNNGPTNRYLRQPRGAPTQNMLELLPENLRGRIRGAIHRAAMEAKPVSVRALLAGAAGRKRQVTLRISKMRENLFLIIFREKRSAEEAGDISSEGNVDENVVRQFESELSATRGELQSHMQQLESLNEELQSSNEELQVANEELETSREELQSLNEELMTVNAQLQSKIEEEEEINNDLNNFLSSTDIPTFFLDNQFRVKRFTPAMSRLLRLIPSDIGRPIIDMSQENLGSELIADAREVLNRLAPIRREIPINGGRYIRVTLPYRTSDNRIEGVVITYNDVSDLKRAEERTRHLASFPQLNPNPVLEVDASGAIVFSNAATEKILEECGMDMTDVTVFLPQDIDNVLRDLEKKEKMSFTREVEIKDRVFAEMVHFAPQFGVVRIYAFEITTRKRVESVAQARLRILETAYRTDLSLDDILRMVLDEIEAQTRSTIGFYHFLEADQETLNLQNWSTNTLEKMCTAEGKGSHYPVSQAGVWVDCVRERRPVIHNEYASMPNRKGMPPGHAPVIREMVVPVMRSNSVVAIIGVGNKPTDYNKTDVDIASLLGDFSWEIVERKRAEEALRASEANYRSLFESSADGIFIIDLDGKFIDANRTAYERLGYTREEFLSLNIRKLDHPSFASLVSERFNMIRQHGFAIFESGHLRKDGSVLPVEVNSRLLEYKGKQVFFSVIRDITERKRAEEALLATSERYRSYIDVTGQLGWTTNADGEVVEDIPSWRAYTGQTYDGVRGWGWAKALHPDDVKHTEQVWKKAVSEKSSYEVEYRLRRHDGIYRHFMARGIPVFMEDGSVREWVGTCIDITERKLAEQELIRLNKTLKALSDSSQAVTHTKDEPQYLDDVCRIIVEDCGYVMAWIGFTEDDEEKSVKPVAHAGFEAGYLKALNLTWADTERGRGPTGTAIRTRKMAACRNMLTDPAFIPWREDAIKRGYASSIAFPLIANDKVFGAITIYSKDADPFSEGEVKLLTELADNLAYGIQTLRIRDEKDKLSEDMATRNVDLENVNKELEAFIYSISHDLRAPIRAVAGFARFLYQDYGDKLDDQARDYINRICAASGKVTLLIDDLLRLAKISRQEVDLANIDLTKLASTVVADLRETDPERSVEVGIAEGLTVFADRRLMEIVLSNLLGNAWKFTSKTEDARIEFGATEKDGKTVYYIRDNGAGFNPQYMEKIFWPFQRLHSESEFEGTGIGLTIVERITHRHGGRIWAEGEVGKGATIYFTMG